ncbi:MAG: hypothetical protein ACI97A_004373, partial [Planctomycetota bacterium]
RGGGCDGLARPNYWLWGHNCRRLLGSKIDLVNKLELSLSNTRF